MAEGGTAGREARRHPCAGGAARFVSGGLDPAQSREEFLALARRVTDPILVVYRVGTAPKSQAAMEALAALPNDEAAVFPAGDLAVHEEFPDAVADIVGRLPGG